MSGSLTTRLLGGFAALALLTVVVGAVNLHSLSLLNEGSATLYNRDYLAAQQVEAARVAAFTYRLSVVGMIHSPDEAERQMLIARMRTSDEAFAQAMRQIQPLLVAAEGQDLSRQIEQAWAQYTPVSDQVVALALAGRTDEAERLSRSTGRERKDAIDELLQQLSGVKSRIASDQVRAADTTYLTVRALTVALLLVALFAGAGILMIIRRLTREIQGGVQSLAGATGEILASVTQQGASTTEQAAAVSQTTATVDEVRVTAQQATQRAQAVAAMAQRAAEVAGQGLGTVERTVVGMQEIRSRVESIAEQILALSEQTQQVGEIIATVEDLADQSNLLAVNAAIEASRAGEQGRGFAVVAQEVRSLAERSKTATVQVRTILTDIQRATNAAVLATEQGTRGAEEGGRLVEQAGQAIRQLAATIGESAEAAQQIVASAGQQNAGMDQIAGAMASINQATTETAAGTRQLQTAAQNLESLARRLREMVDRSNSNGRV